MKISLILIPFGDSNSQQYRLSQNLHFVISKHIYFFL